tara:strand:+ start:1916 stop:2239 length:324 start_codon:yes stop_codon:yes gene_type:complete
VLAEGVPADLGRTAAESYRKVIWTGIVMENLPGTTLPECSEMAGLSRANHSSAFDWLAKWRLLDWRVRHGWLVLAESMMQGEEWNTRKFYLHIEDLRREEERGKTHA